MVRTTEKAITYYRKQIINYVESKCRKQQIIDTVLLLNSATDDDIAYWGKRFKDCRRGRQAGSVVFEMKDKGG